MRFETTLLRENPQGMKWNNHGIMFDSGLTFLFTSFCRRSRRSMRDKGRSHGPVPSLAVDEVLARTEPVIGRLKHGGGETDLRELRQVLG